MVKRGGICARWPSNRALFRVALGVVFFWSVGALAQLNVDQFAFESGALYETDKVPLLLALVLGVGFGSVLAGIWSGGRIELGILPLGAFGVAVCSMLLFTDGRQLIEPVAGHWQRHGLGPASTVLARGPVPACFRSRWRHTCSIAARRRNEARCWRR